MKKMLQSAWANYPCFGCDIGGYRGGNRTGSYVETFVRWFQLGAFLPLMENGGDGEHRPWMYDEPNSTTIVDTYRSFVEMHLSLGPYLLTIGTQAYENGTSSLLPLAPWSSFVDKVIEDFFPETFDYYLGPHIFVSPIIVENTVLKNVSFPAGSNWVSMFNSSMVFSGGEWAWVPVPMTEFAAFQQQGAIIPMKVTKDEFPLYGNRFSRDALTIVVHTPLDVTTMSSHSLIVMRSAAPLFERHCINAEMRERHNIGLKMGYTFDSYKHVLRLSLSAFKTSPVVILLQQVRSCSHIEIQDHDNSQLTLSQTIQSYDGVAVKRALLHEVSSSESLSTVVRLDDITSGAFFFDATNSNLFVRPSGLANGCELYIHNLCVVNP